MKKIYMRCTLEMMELRGALPELGQYDVKVTEQGVEYIVLKD